MNAIRAGLLVLLVVSGNASAQWDYGYEESFICESIKQRTNYCAVDTRGGVELVDQLSRAPCIEGQSWGYDRRGVWVAQGCRAEFIAHEPRGRGYGHGGYHGGYDQGYATITCESRDQRTARCPVRIRRGAELVNQLSRADCIEDETWGYDRNGIWVSNGCRGEFAVE